MAMDVYEITYWLSLTNELELTQQGEIKNVLKEEKIVGYTKLVCVTETEYSNWIFYSKFVCLFTVGLPQIILCISGKQEQKTM